MFFFRKPKTILHLFIAKPTLILSKNSFVSKPESAALLELPLFQRSRQTEQTSNTSFPNRNVMQFVKPTRCQKTLCILTTQDNATDDGVVDVVALLPRMRYALVRWANPRCICTFIRARIQAYIFTWQIYAIHQTNYARSLSYGFCVVCQTLTCTRGANEWAINPHMWLMHLSISVY